MKDSSTTTARLTSDIPESHVESEKTDEVQELAPTEMKTATTDQSARQTKLSRATSSKTGKNEASVKAPKLGGDNKLGKPATKLLEKVSPTNSTNLSKYKAVPEKDSPSALSKTKSIPVGSPNPAPSPSQDYTQVTSNGNKSALPVATIRLDSTLTPADFEETHTKGVMATRGNLAMIPNKARRYFTELLGSFPTMQNAKPDRDPVEEIVYNKFSALLPVLDQLDHDLQTFFRKIQQE